MLVKNIGHLSVSKIFTLCVQSGIVFQASGIQCGKGNHNISNGVQYQRPFGNRKRLGGTALQTWEKRTERGKEVKVVAWGRLPSTCAHVVLIGDPEEIYRILTIVSLFSGTLQILLLWWKIILLGELFLPIHLKMTNQKVTGRLLLAKLKLPNFHWPLDICLSGAK